MEIEWSEGPASRCAGTVRRSTADNTTRSETGCCGKMLRRECVRQPEGEICSAIRQRATDRGAARRFCCWGELFHAAALPPGGERSCISAAGNLSTTTIGPAHLGQGQRSRESLVRGVSCLSAATSRVTESKEARKRHVAGWPRSRSAGCARSHPEASATGSDAGIHRVRESSVAVHFCERSHANET